MLNSATYLEYFKKSEDNFIANIYLHFFQDIVYVLLGYITLRYNMYWVVNLHSWLDKIWNHLGDTHLHMSVMMFPKRFNWQGKIAFECGSTIPWAENPGWIKWKSKMPVRHQHPSLLASRMKTEYNELFHSPVVMSSLPQSTLPLQTRGISEPFLPWVAFDICFGTEK